jgi:Ni,Fe-hydrogenase maturation factor
MMREPSGVAENWQNTSDQLNRQPETSTQILIVGIGSPHGDDSAGWHVVEQLRHHLGTGVESGLQTESTSRFQPSRAAPRSIQLRQAMVPHDLIDWLSDCTALYIIDSCDSKESPAVPSRFEIVLDPSSLPPRLRLRARHVLGSKTSAFLMAPRLRSAGSHQLDLLTVLELAACLRLLPSKVSLWTIPGACFRPDESMSEACELAIAICAKQIGEELDFEGIFPSVEEVDGKMKK